MSVDALQLTRDMVAIPSVSHDSNAEVSDLAQRVLEREGFEVERLTYPDKDGRDALKVSLVAKKGSGTGGIGFFSHTDTVPGDVGWNPFDPALRDGKLYGRGSCDMKGPAAATIEAACSVDVRALKRPVYIALTADEENGYHGALQITHESALLKQNWPAFGVVAEPTELRPVYSHKGGTSIIVTAKGVAAHTSTERGTSANFLIAPFLAEMAALAPVFKSDPRFLNHEFSPPSFGFNMTLNDHGTKLNVSAGRSTCALSIRNMPNVQNEEAIELICAAARKHGLEATVKGMDYFYAAPDNPMAKLACEATGVAKAETVPYGTEAVVYQTKLPNQVVLGPGNIAQAHTVGEWIDVKQLTDSVGVYRKLIERVCVEA